MTRDTAEFDARMAKARAALPPLPDTLDGMELGNRLLDYDPDTWSSRFTVADLARGEIISLVLPEEARAFGDHAKPRRYVVLANRAAPDGSHDLKLFDLVHPDVGMELRAVSTDWPVSLRLDLVYLDPNAPDGGAAWRDPDDHKPEPVQAVQPVTPVEPESLAWEIDPALLQLATVPINIGSTPDDTAVKYRGVPVPQHLLGGWPDSSDAVAWRHGVNDTLRELGMAEVVPLHLRPVVQDQLLIRCGDTHAHGPHRYAEWENGRTSHYSCPGHP